jgi:hypothetical protein
VVIDASPALFSLPSSAVSSTRRLRHGRRCAAIGRDERIDGLRRLLNADWSSRLEYSAEAALQLMLKVGGSKRRGCRGSQNIDVAF